VLEKIKNIGLTNWIMISMVIGGIAGLLVGPSIEPVGILGDIFIRLIQMSVPVLIFGAVIEAVGDLDPIDLGKLGLKMFGWFAAFTVVGSAIGVILGIILEPGIGVAGNTAVDATPSTDMSLYDTIVGFFPENVVEALASGNMIQIIVFAIIFGLAISIIMKENPDNKVLSFVKDINVLIQKVIALVMYFAPIGIFAIVAEVVGTSGLEVILQLGMFLLVFLIGAILLLIIALLVTSAKARVNPWHVARKLKRTFVVAVTTTSSSVAMPIKMEDSKNLFGMSDRINNLVNPIGTALNSSGQSMFLSVAVVFLAQFYGIEMSLTYLIYAIALASISTLGTVTVPGGGIVALTVMVPFLGLPTTSIGLLAGVDWFSGMIRTPLNTIIDTLIAMVIASDEDELDREVFDENF